MVQPQEQQRDQAVMSPEQQQSQEGDCFRMGMRRLMPGEVLHETDLYKSSTGKWERVPCPGAIVVENGVEFLRPLKVEFEV